MQPQFPDVQHHWHPQLEKCGFVLKDGSTVEVTNAHPDPQNGFRINAEDILRYEPQVVATWHTHPFTGPNLSVEDYQCFLAWQEWLHIIAHAEEVWVYYVEQNKVFLHDDLDLPRLPEGTLP